jgi:hypothetical protein
VEIQPRVSADITMPTDRTLRQSPFPRIAAEHREQPSMVLVGHFQKHENNGPSVMLLSTLIFNAGYQRKIEEKTRLQDHLISKQKKRTRLLMPFAPVAAVEHKSGD